MRLYDIPSRFTTTEFACKCKCGFGSKEEDIDKRLIDFLNILRLLYNNPMVVTSGARCPSYNRLVKGEPESAHLPHINSQQCRAADIYVPDGHARHRLLALAYTIGIHAQVERIGDGQTFIHLDSAWDLSKPVSWVY